MPMGRGTYWGKLGRLHVVQDIEAVLPILHQPFPSTQLRVADHEPPVAVLDQEDLLKQGIDVSTFIPGAVKGTTELGSCTAQTSLEYLSGKLILPSFISLVNKLGVQNVMESASTVYNNPIAVERAAIGFYHACTSLTGQRSEEWPPVDCGSTGQWCFEYMQKLGLTKQDQVAMGAEAICSMLQHGAAMWGTTWFNAWFNPNAAGFIDGNGSPFALQTQVASGVAGGHEILITAIEKIAFLATGQVDPRNTVLRFRNHWTKSWGDNGSARVHLSTLVSPTLGNYVDVRQPVILNV